MTPSRMITASAVYSRGDTMGHTVVSTNDFRQCFCFSCFGVCFAAPVSIVGAGTTACMRNSQRLGFGLPLNPYGGQAAGKARWTPKTGHRGVQRARHENRPARLESEPRLITGTAQKWPLLSLPDSRSNIPRTRNQAAPASWRCLPYTKETSYRAAP